MYTATKMVLLQIMFPTYCLKKIYILKNLTHLINSRQDRGAEEETNS